MPKIPNQWRVTVRRKPPNPRRGTSFKRKPMRGRSTIGSVSHTSRCEPHGQVRATRADKQKTKKRRTKNEQRTNKERTKDGASRTGR